MVMDSFVSERRHRAEFWFTTTTAPSGGRSRPHTTPNFHGADFYTRPVKSRPGLHVEWVDDEAVVLDEESTRLHYLNSAAAAVFALIAEFGFDQAVERVRASFGDKPFENGEFDALVADMVDKGLLVDD